jgi:protein gp37
MAEKTGISWTDHTFNVAWGCDKVSPGCKFCYADVASARFGFDVWGKHKPRRTLSEHYWNEPIRWNRKAEKAGEIHKVFSSSMCDIFEDHPTISQELQKLWVLIKKTPYLTWQLLTKRAERIAQCLPFDWGEGYSNVWLGVSVENSDYLYRIEHLRKIPCGIRFISYEPALGPLTEIDLTGIKWLIYGGESGSNFRKDDRQWAINIKEKCKECGVAFFYKQGSGLLPGTCDKLDNTEYKEFPDENRRIS